MSLSLSAITNSLEQLIADREEVLAGEMCGACIGTESQFSPCSSCNNSGFVVNKASLELIEGAIKQYSQDLLPAKVDAYWFTLKKIGKADESKPLAQQAGLIADAKREIKRLQHLIDEWDALQKTLRGYALDAMRQGNTWAIEGTNGRKLKRQANGGALAVEVVQAHLVPENLQIVTVRANAAFWRHIVRKIGSMEDAFEGNVKVSMPEPDLTAIRKELEKRVPCPECLGVDPKGEQEDNHFCGMCGGEGTVPNGVPGCRLAARGEHLRVP